MNDVIPKVRKSVRLTTDELKALKKYRKGFASETECADALGISRQVLNRILIVGSGAEDSIKIIREAIG